METTGAWIGFVGILIGLFSSYFLQALQRKWGHDDQKHEWRRGQLKLISEKTNAFAGDFVKNNLSGEEPGYSNDAWAELFTKIDVSFDEELNQIYYRNWMPAIINVLEAKRGSEQRSEMLHKFRETNFIMQSRINKLIEETYR